jgi:hypothetical protein
MVFVNLPRAEHQGGQFDEWSESDQRILGSLGKFVPRDESGSKLFSIKRSAQQMPLEREMLPDWPEAREKLLCSFWVAKAVHAALSFARRLMAVLCGVVQSGGSFDKHVLHVGKFRDLGLCRRISHQHRIVSYVTITPRSKSNSSMSRKLNWKRKYQRTAQLMTPAGKRWP